MAELLAKRRDALLANDREALAEIDTALEELRKREPLAGDEGAAEFMAGLTERQRQVLARILPGVGRHEVRMHTRALPGRVEVWRMGPAPLPGPHRRMPPEGGRFSAFPGPNLELVDILIDLLDR